MSPVFVSIALACALLVVLIFRKSLLQQFPLPEFERRLLRIRTEIFDARFGDRVRRNMGRRYVHPSTIEFCCFAPGRLALFAQQPVDEHDLGIWMSRIGKANDAASPCSDQAAVFF